MHACSQNTFMTILCLLLCYAIAVYHSVVIILLVMNEVQNLAEHVIGVYIGKLRKYNLYTPVCIVIIIVRLMNSIVMHA